MGLILGLVTVTMVTGYGCGGLEIKSEWGSRRTFCFIFNVKVRLKEVMVLGLRLRITRNLRELGIGKS